MHQISYFSGLKDKNLKFLYETITKHLHNLESLADTKQIDEYMISLKSYMNGHTKKDSLFKDLRKSEAFMYPIHPLILLEYAKFKAYYLSKSMLKNLDELYLYATHTSTFGFLLLTCGESFLKPLELIEKVSIIDKLTDLLTGFQSLQKQNKFSFPIGLINDYDIDFTLNNEFLMNHKFIAMWDMLAYKCFMLINDLQTKLHLFEETHQIILKEFLKDIKNKLSTFEKTVIKINR